MNIYHKINKKCIYSPFQLTSHKWLVASLNFLSILSAKSWKNSTWSYNCIILVLHCQVSCYDLFFFCFSYFSFLVVVPVCAIVGYYEKRYVGKLGCSVTTPRYHLYVLWSSYMLTNNKTIMISAVLGVWK